MSAASVVFPHQLSEKNLSLIKAQPVYLIEEFLFFNQYNFHKQKLVFHRASMKAYQYYLQEKGYEVTYVDAKEKIADVLQLLLHLKRKGVSEIHYCDVSDNWLEKRISRQAETLKLKVTKHESPLFILSSKQVASYFSTKKRFFQTDFYTQQRKHFKILVDKELQPTGGKWTFDMKTG